MTGRTARRRGGGTSVVRTFGSVVAAGALVAATVVTMAGTAGAAPAEHAHHAHHASKTGGSVRIVIGGAATFTDGSLFKAIDIMKHHHVTVTLSALTDPSSALEAVVSGKADLYLGDPIEAATAVANSGAAVKYIGTVDQTTSYEILSAPQFNLKNLTNVTIGSAGPGTAGIIISDAALAKKGVTMNNVHAVTVGGTSARVTALLSGQVDLAPALAPAAVAAVSTGKVKILLNVGKVLGRYLQEGLIASDTFITKHKSTAQTVVDAFLSSQKWAMTHEKGYLSLVKANKITTTLTPAQQKGSWKQLTNSKFFSTTGAICPKAISITENYSFQTATATLSKTDAPKYKAWVDPHFVKNYLKKNHQSPHAC